MKKKLGRLLNPGAGIFFAVLFLFSAVAVLFKPYGYFLATGEFAATVLFLVLYLTGRAKRRDKIEAFLRRAVDHQPDIGMA